MRQPPKTLGYSDVFPGMMLTSVIVLFFGPWIFPLGIIGVAKAVFAIVSTSFVLAVHPGSTSRFFVFGVFCSLLFVPSFCAQMADYRFRRSLMYFDSATEYYAFGWLTFPLGLGFFAGVRQRRARAFRQRSN